MYWLGQTLKHQHLPYHTLVLISYQYSSLKTLLLILVSLEDKNSYLGKYDFLYFYSCEVTCSSWPMLFLSAPHHPLPGNVLSGHKQVMSVSLVPASDSRNLQHTHSLFGLVSHTHSRELILQRMTRNCHQPHPRTHFWQLVLIFVLIHFRSFLYAGCGIWEGFDMVWLGSWKYWLN